jgi:hypothetical protein
VISAVFRMPWTAADSLAATRARRRLGMAIAAMIKNGMVASLMDSRASSAMAKPSPGTRPMLLRVSASDRCPKTNSSDSAGRTGLADTTRGAVAIGSGLPHNRQKRPASDNVFPHLAQSTTLATPQAANSILYLGLRESKVADWAPGWAPSSGRAETWSGRIGER